MTRKDEGKIKEIAKKMGHDPKYLDVIRILPGAIKVTKKNDKKK